MLIAACTSAQRAPDGTRDAGSASSGGDSAPGAVWRPGPRLPQPVTNNAAAAVELGGTVSVFSFLGLDSTKTWSGVTDAAFRWDVGDDRWREIAAVPGPGRLAATAQAVDGLVYVIGGYTVDEDGSERSVPDVNVLDPATETWTRGADIPIPADDAISGVWRGRRIVLVSGWHDTANVADVQLYDPSADEWSAATPIAGEPVFGHTGAVVGGHVVYVDGTKVVPGRPRFAIERSSWSGAIAPDDPTVIRWTPAPARPGPALYRAASGAVDRYALFLGGSDNPYNYDGIGYDGTPSEPVHQLLAYDPAAALWRTLEPPPAATMDHRTLGVAGGLVFLVGGMESGQRVSDRAWTASIDHLLAGR